MSSARTRQLASPEPPLSSPSERRGSSVYEALNNYTSLLGGALGPASPVKQSASATFLTSRTGGRFRASGSMSGTSSVAGDSLTAQLVYSLNGGADTPFGPAMTFNTAAVTGAFAVSIEAETPAIPIGSTVNVAIRVTDNVGGNTVSSPASGSYASMQEIPA